MNLNKRNDCGRAQFLGLLGIALLGAGYTLNAQAACSVNADAKESWSMPSSLLAPKTSMAVAVAEAANDQAGGSSGSAEGIVGVWKFQFISEGNSALQIPDGAQLDAGHVTWHSDRSELMNSGRAPIVGDFCMGVWKKVGRHTYQLNHFASNWVIDPTSKPFGEKTLGPTIIRETVTVDSDDDVYTGTFNITNYEPDGKTVLGPVITGVVYGRRETLTSID